VPVEKANGVANRVTVVKSAKGDTVEDTFEAFSKDGRMSQAQFAKLCKDTGIVKKGATAEIAFNSTKQIGKNRIDLKEFHSALASVAKKEQMDLEDVAAKVAASQGPVFSGTAPEKVERDDSRDRTGEFEHDAAQHWQRYVHAGDWQSP
jgi:hypothetical protein